MIVLRRSAHRARPAAGYEPTAEEVDALIAAARRHPLGLDFLREGALDSVSAIFGVHAFVVDRARASLASCDSMKRQPAASV